MLRKIQNIFFLISFIIFFFFIFKYYFSEHNIKFTNKSRTNYLIDLMEKEKNLPLLKSDTNNIIIYQNGVEEFKKKRKKRIWENLISNNE
tara:strand:- start:3413 stop:3682 length:270 start_codon:yes stop_codon:yes gene_type:complete